MYVTDCDKVFCGFCDRHRHTIDFLALKGRPSRGRNRPRGGGDAESSGWHSSGFPGVRAIRRPSSCAGASEGVSNAYLPNGKRVTSSTVPFEAGVRDRVPSLTYGRHMKNLNQQNSPTRSANASLSRWCERRGPHRIAPIPNEVTNGACAPSTFGAVSKRWRPRITLA